MQNDKTNPSNKGESAFLKLLGKKDFYHSLVMPLILLMLIILTPSKVAIVLLSMILGVCLIYTLHVIADVFSE